jgi:hypothetical protein
VAVAFGFKKKVSAIQKKRSNLVKPARNGPTGRLGERDAQRPPSTSIVIFDGRRVEPIGQEHSRTLSPLYP